MPESPSKSSLSPSPSPIPSTRRPSNPRAAADSPSVTSSLSSLYSAYSYYQLDSPSPSPTTDTLQVPPSPYAPPPHTPPPRTPSPLNPAPAPKGNPEQLVLADQLLQEGIQHHEANRLKEAAAAFERSAKTPGGSGVGMLMWGLTLRHGWGCPKDEVLGFSWLRRAAEAAVGDLEHARTGIDASAVRGELVLAIYEVGQCFFQGWGVKKDQKMAVSYFQVAAKLGDMDAQQELAFCYANGRGCKKDRKEAAQWYRAAVAQGASDVGLAWIYKEKFQ
ncbi:HCP-like protein [Lactarius vividus]|nr:HCP-like protein [Lactarius vividus]